MSKRFAAVGLYGCKSHIKDTHEEGGQREANYQPSDEKTFAAGCGLAPEVFDSGVIHSERSTMRFRTIVETLAGHDGNPCCS